MKIKSEKFNKFQRLFKKNKRFRYITLALGAVLVVTVFVLFSVLLTRLDGTSKITAAIPSEPEKLDPTFCSDVQTETILVNCFEGLMVFDENGDVKKGCATDYSVSDDGLVYTFTISQNAVWSNGQPVTASDFVYSWQRTANPYNASHYAYLFENIAGYDKVISDFEKEKNSELDEEGNLVTMQMSDMWVKSADSKTLVVKLKEKDPAFLKKCAMVAFFPLCENSVKQYTRIWSTDKKLFVSNGAFKLSSWTAGSYLELERNEYFRDKDNVKIKTMRFEFVADGKEAEKEFKNSNVLFTSSLDGSRLEKTARKKEYMSYENFGSYFLYFNLSKTPFDDVKVRQALTLAIDREALIAETCPERGKAASTLFSNGEECFDVSLTQENIEKAKKLLSEAGYKDGKGFPEFEYLYNDNTFSRETAELLKKMWEENLGIKCNLKCVSWSKLDEMRKSGDFSVAKGGAIAPYNDAAYLLSQFSSENNFISWKNAEYDSLVKQMLNSSADENGISDKAEKILSDNYVICPLYYYQDGYLISHRVKNYYVTNSGVAYFMYAEVSVF